MYLFRVSENDSIAMERPNTTHEKREGEGEKRDGKEGEERGGGRKKERKRRKFPKGEEKVSMNIFHP